MNKLDATNITRRTALKAGSTGLLLGFSLASNTLLMAQSMTAQESALNPFIHIGTDDVITLIIHKPENGQGSVTALSMLLAEELECDLNSIHWEFAPIERVYGFPLQGTFGSLGIRTSWQPLREAGAAARMMLIQAAADRWDIDPALCRAANAAVVNNTTGSSLRYGELVDAAAALPVPGNIVLKPAADFQLIGKPMPRLDTPLKITGQATYGIDVRVENMLFGLLVRPPVAGGSLISFDASKTLAVPGVQNVVEVSYGVAVVADNTWAALQGRNALEIEWQHGPNAKLSSAGIHEQLEALTSQSGAVARSLGDSNLALSQASTRVTANYGAPYLAHATMEPPNCTARVETDHCELWSGTQIPGLAHLSSVAATGLEPSQVKVNTQYIGGGFGSRGGGNVYAESVEIAKAVGQAVNLLYTREDDIQHDRYRPVAFARLEAALDADGWPTAWTGHVACQSFQAMQNGVDREGVAGLADVSYQFPNVHIEYSPLENDIATNFWRSVGHSQNTFFAEAFLDELAAVTNKDPVNYRRRLLTDSPRLLNVMNIAAELANWNSPLPAGHFQGIAIASCFGSFNAQIAEVSISNQQLRIHRVTCVVDCGQVINPSTVIQQMEGGIVYGLSAALKGEITLTEGRIEQSNFHQYDVLRMDEMPLIEVHIVPSEAPPGGVGEVSTPAIAPAVVNAVFAATGRPVRSLPIKVEHLV